MSVFEVNADRCNFCGMCAAECPAAVIQMKGPEVPPSLAASGDKRCINCGHCVAICPLDAISLKTMKPEECAPVSKELLPTPGQVEHFLRSRRSIRVYKEQSVPREMLAKLIDIARYAPSGSNMQPVQWLVIEDTKEVRRLTGLVADWMRSTIEESHVMATLMGLDLLVAAWESGADKIMRGAPHLIISHAHRDLVPGQRDGIIALTHLELAAHSLGLGACWAGYFLLAAAFYPPLMDELGLPRGHQCSGALMIGYPKYRFSRIPLRNEPEIMWH